MRKFLLLCGFLLASTTVAHASATDIYTAATTAGAADGSSCGNARAYTYFNSAGNWGGGATQIGANTIYHLCGTITLGAAAVALTCQGSGTSGNPVTIKWETGAILEATYFSGSGAIQCDSRSYLVFDGGTNGIMRNTANGTVLANQQGSSFIHIHPCTSCEIKNLHMENLYVHTSMADNSPGTGGGSAVLYGGTDMLFHDNVVHDVVVAFQANDAAGGASNYRIYNNEIYNCNSCLIITTDGASSDMFVYNNHFHDMYIWDTTANAFHHEALHMFGPGAFANIYIYNNLFDGNQGNCCVTAWVFGEDAFDKITAWNNVLIGTTTGSNGQFLIQYGAAHVLYNNTIIATSGTGWSFNTTSIAAFRNNITNGVQQYASNPFGNWTFTTFNNNDWGLHVATGNQWWNTGTFAGSSLAAWQSSCSCEANSLATTGSNLDISLTTGAPNAGFNGINAGVDLTSVATGVLATLALDTTAGGTRTAVARPIGSNWTMGAYGYGASPSGATSSGISGGTTISSGTSVKF